MNAVAVVLLAFVAVASCTVVAPVAHQYYVPSSYSAVQYVQPSTSNVKYQYVQQPVVHSTVGSDMKYQYQYAVPSTSVYNSVVPSTGVYNTVPSTYYSSPVVSSSYGYSAYSPSYYYPSYPVYGYGKK